MVETQLRYIARTMGINGIDNLFSKDSGTCSKCGSETVVVSKVRNYLAGYDKPQSEPRIRMILIKCSFDNKHTIFKYEATNDTQ